MSYNIDLTKFITGIGLIVDVSGIIVLLLNEIRQRKIDNLKSKGADSSGLEYHKERKKSGAKTPLAITNQEAMIEEEKYPASKALRLSKYGLILIFFGFFIQLIALFFDRSIQIG